jgi:hypothetical protein
LMCGHLFRSSSFQSCKVFDFDLSVHMPGTLYHSDIFSKFRTLCSYKRKIILLLSLWYIYNYWTPCALYQQLLPAFLYLLTSNA